MAGIKYAPKPYDKSVTVLERVEYFRHWFYVTHQKKRCGGNQTRNQRKETESHINTGAVTRQGITSKDGGIMQVKEYALYKGDELLAMGTKHEIVERLGVSVNTVSYYGTPVYARRTSENGRRLVKL